MTAGRRNSLIRLERAMASADDYGEEVLTWGLLSREWASVRFGSGSERRDAASTSASQAASFYVLANPVTRALRPKDRLVMEGVWDVREIAPEGAEVRIVAVRSADSAATEPLPADYLSPNADLPSRVAFAGFGYQSWKVPTYTSAAPLTLLAGQRTAISLSSAVLDIDTLKDAFEGHRFIAGGKVAARAIDDDFEIRLTMQGQSLMINNELRAEIDIGGTLGPVSDDVEGFAYSAGVPRLMTFSFDLFARATFLANGGTLYLTAEQDAQIWNLAFKFDPGSRA